MEDFLHTSAELDDEQMEDEMPLMEFSVVNNVKYVAAIVQ